MNKIMLILFLSAVFTINNISAQDSLTSKAKLLKPAAFQEAIQNAVNPVIIDVRDFKHFKRWQIKGALHAPSRKILKHITDSLDKNQPVFIYCEIGFSSKIAAKVLTDQGFSNVFNLEKGLKNWRKKGYPVTRIHKNERKNND